MTKQTISKTAAVQTARDRVGSIIRRGYHDFVWYVYSPKHNANFERKASDYWMAQAGRREDLIATAVAALHPDDEDAWDDGLWRAEATEGDWTRQVY